MQGRGAVRPPIGIALDADIGNRVDAILAVAMLNGMTAKTEARRISLSVSKPSVASAQLAGGGIANEGGSDGARASSRPRARRRLGCERGRSAGSASSATPARIATRPSPRI